MDRIVISKETDSVFKNGRSVFNLSISFPENVTALYWQSNSGWVEKEGVGREEIFSLEGWAVDAISKFDVATEPVDPIPVPLDEKRKSAYQAESDPLFFKAQRGEATMDQWKDKVAEIKARYPKG